MAQRKRQQSLASPAMANEERRTLWKVSLRFPSGFRDPKEQFLFREVDDFSVAAVTAQALLDSSSAAQMTGAEIVSVERVAHLWN